MVLKDGVGIYTNILEENELKNGFLRLLSYHVSKLSERAPTAFWKSSSFLFFKKKVIPDNNYDTLHVCKGKPTDPFFVSIETNALLHKYIQYFSYSEDAQ